MVDFQTPFPAEVPGFLKFVVLETAAAASRPVLAEPGRGVAILLAGGAVVGRLVSTAAVVTGLLLPASVLEVGLQKKYQPNSKILFLHH